MKANRRLSIVSVASILMLMVNILAFGRSMSGSPFNGLSESDFLEMIGDWTGEYEDKFLDEGEYVDVRMRLFLRIIDEGNNLLVRRKTMQLFGKREVEYLPDVRLFKKGDKYYQECCLTKRMLSYNESVRRFGETSCQEWVTKNYELNYSNGVLLYYRYNHIEYVNPSGQLKGKRDEVIHKITLSKGSDNW